MTTWRSTLLFIVLAAATGDGAGAEWQAQYIANAGVMVVSGDTKVVFDPLFREDFDQYDLAPPDMQQRLIAGDPPFDGIDAVFVSHSHDDHFDPYLMLAFLQHNESTRFFGPEQAVSALRRARRDLTDAVADRLHVVSPEFALPPVEIEIGGLRITAMNVPHTGWPEFMNDIENVAFSVTLNAEMTVVHLGDADTYRGHFERYDEFWRAQHHHLALPPYWFFLDDDGRRSLSEHIAADHSVGVHVPTDMPDAAEDRPADFDGFDLFTRPAEVRNAGSFDEQSAKKKRELSPN